MVYDCEVAGTYLAHSNIGLFLGVYYIFMGVVAIRIGQQTKTSSTAETRRRFATFHCINALNLVFSMGFLLVNLFLMYTLVERIHSCTSFNWSMLNFIKWDGWNSVQWNWNTSVIRISAAEDALARLQEREAYELAEINAAVTCALIANGFHGLVATLEIFLTFVGCLCRVS